MSRASSNLKSRNSSRVGGMDIRESTIAEICDMNRANVSQKDCPDSIYYLDTGNITRNKIEKLVFLSKARDGYPSRAQRKVRDKTIIYSTVRPNQEHYGILKNPVENLIVSTGFITLDVVDEKIDPLYLFYSLTRKEITDYLHGIGENSVSAYPSINPSDLGTLNLIFPKKLSDQKKIAAVLSALDAKIELNNRINVELEAMAKTLYDYWFVQFDFPDANGRPYKSSGGKMVYNETLMRKIPEGWLDKTLSEIANITMGQSPAGDSFNESGDGAVFFQGATDFGWLFPTTRQYTKAPSRMAKKGDILLSVRAPVGDMNIANYDCCIGRGLAALNSKQGFDGFLFYVMKYFKQIFDRRNSEGTTFGSITKNDLHSLPLAYPDDALLKKYDAIVSKNNKIIFSRSLENQQLTSLRDFLLPMLMNGQVQV